MTTEVVKTIRASGGDYSTYNGWVDGEARDLIAADEIAIAEIYNDWANGGLSTASPSAISSANGWETGPDNYVVLRAASGHKHNGRPLDANGHYTGANLCTSSTGTYTWTTTHLRVEGLILEHRDSGTSTRHLMSTSIGTGGGKPPNLIVLDSCLVGARNQAAGSTAIRVAQGRRDSLLRNCAVWNGSVQYAFAGHAQAQAWVLNCTAANARATGFAGTIGTVEIVNCLSTGAATADFSVSGAGQNCAASDASLPSGNGNRNSQTFTFVDAANHDYRLTGADAGARTYGQNLSAHPTFPFAVDALGNARGAVWDIGAFQVTSAGPQPPEGSTTITSATPTAEGVAGAFEYDDSDATGFEYQIDAGSWADLGDPDPRLYEVTGQTERTDYTIRIRPYNAQGPGAPSAPVAYRTLPDVRLFDLQAHDAQIGTVDGDQIILPVGVTQARTYALYEAGGMFVESVLHVDWEAEAGPAPELSGDATGSADATGALTTAIPLAGASISVAAASGTITTAIPLAGVSGADSSATGALDAAILLAGAAAGQASATGSMAQETLIAGSAVAGVTAEGNLLTEIRLSGAAIASALSAAGIDTAVLLAAAAQGSAAATGDLGGAPTLAGSAQASAQASGDITATIRLSGAALAAALASGDLSTESAGLAGSAQASAQASGAMTTAIPLIGAAAAAVSASGDLSRLVTLDGAAASVTSAFGSLDTQLWLSAEAVGAALAAGALSVQVQFSGAAVAQAVASGRLSSGIATPSPYRVIRVSKEARMLKVRA